MIDQEARATHAVHAQHNPKPIPPLPSYLRYQRENFTFEASEHRHGEWRHYHFTTLRTHLVERLEDDITGTTAKLVPMANHRVELDGDQVKRQRVPYSLADHRVRRELTLFTKRLTHSLADHVLGDLSESNATPGAIGISREPNRCTGHPEPLDGHPSRSGGCDQLQQWQHRGLHDWLGTFDMAPWMDNIHRVGLRAG